MLLCLTGASRSQSASKEEKPGEARLRLRAHALPGLERLRQRDGRDSKYEGAHGEVTREHLISLLV